MQLASTTGFRCIFCNWFYVLDNSQCLRTFSTRKCRRCTCVSSSYISYIHACFLRLWRLCATAYVPKVQKLQTIHYKHTSIHVYIYMCVSIHIYIHISTVSVFIRTNIHLSVETGNCEEYVLEMCIEYLQSCKTNSSNGWLQSCIHFINISMHASLISCTYLLMPNSLCYIHACASYTDFPIGLSTRSKSITNAHIRLTGDW